MVPAIWTDLTSDTNSATLILTVEYFFRHTWGWQSGWDEPRWLTEEEIANGRRYRSRERRGQRYDAGIGYSARSVRSALAEGVRQRWLVWREDETTGKKRYALHLRGMNVSPVGEFLGFQGNATKEDDSPLPTNQEPPETDLPPASKNGPHEETTVHLQAQVATLARTVGQLQKAVSLAFSDSFQDQEGVEANRAPLEANRAPLEAIGAPDGSYQSASYTDTFSDTSVQTPPPDTALDEVKDAAAAAMPNSSDSGGGIPSALLNRLASLEPPVSPEVATDLIATFGQQRVAATLDAVERDPTVTSIAAVLIYRLRAGQTPPGGKQLEETMATGGERASRWEPDAG
jgi:hypothetical protein